jgi:SAM-dependent methyltransferase
MSAEPARLYGNVCRCHRLLRRLLGSLTRTPAKRSSPRCASSSESFIILSALLNATKRRAIRNALEAHEGQADRRCPCCGYVGKFRNFGSDGRPGAQCPACLSLERHRLLRLAVLQGVSFDGKRILHFAPEEAVTAEVKKAKAVAYETADLVSGRAMVTLDIENIDRPAEAYDLIICSHVLEHVDDRKAIAEMFRILAPGGLLVALVPVIEGWLTTYEDSSKTSEKERELYFGQIDHVRLYGADLRDRVRAAGFVLDEFTAGGVESAQYSLQRGDKVFLATKPDVRS